MAQSHLHSKDEQILLSILDAIADHPNETKYKLSCQPYIEPGIICHITSTRSNIHAQIYRSLHIANLTKLFHNPSLSLNILLKLGFGYGDQQPLIGSLSHVRKQNEQHSYRLYYKRPSIESIDQETANDSNITQSLQNCAIRASNSTIDIDSVIIDATNRLTDSVMQQLLPTIEQCIDAKDFVTLECLLNETIHEHEKQQRKQNIKIYGDGRFIRMSSYRDLTVEECLEKAEQYMPPIIWQEILQIMKYFDFNDTNDVCLFKKIVADRCDCVARFKLMRQSELLLNEFLYENMNQEKLPGISEWTLYLRQDEFINCQDFPEIATLQLRVKQFIKQYKHDYLQYKSTCKTLLNKSNSNSNDSGDGHSKWHCYKCGSINSKCEDDYCIKCNQGVNPLLFPRINKSNDFLVTKPFGLIRTKVRFFLFVELFVWLFSSVCIYIAITIIYCGSQHPRTHSPSHYAVPIVIIIRVMLQNIIVF